LLSLIRTTTALAIVAAAVLGPHVPHAVAADHVTHSGVVSAVPADYTPDVNDGTVFAIAQSGPTVVIGGDFTSISPRGDGGTVYPVNHIAAFTAGTGAIATGFAPTINGTVNAVLPGVQAGTIYVAGNFTQIDGTTSHLALIDTTSGALVPGWTSPSFGGSGATKVNTLALSGNRLFVGGVFSSVSGQSRQSLVALNPSSGAVETAYSTPSFSGHHNYQRLCTPSASVTCAKADPGIRALDVNPANTRLVATGNFTTVGSQTRDQLAILDLGGSAATVDRNWATDAYTSPCDSASFDSYVRGVQFSPDGSYFVVADTGGTRRPNSDGTRGTCDAAARFDTSASGSDVLPTWVDYTGRDTFLSVAITGPAVYIGGHERWVNNSAGEDTPGEGAVPRPGITALDPTNGMPLAWNPGRNPRGAGAWALLATSDGLYVGSDTNTIGPGSSDLADTYTRKKLAFFPLAGGKALAANHVTPLPGNVYLLGTATGTGSDNGATAVPFNGEAPPSATTSLSGVSDWVSTVRGAFEIDDTVYYGSTDGNFYQRSFDGLNFGPPVVIDPYHDPVWDGVPTGSDGENYDGTRSAFYDSILSLTSLFYSNGRVYYTVAGQTHMFWRWFEPDSGVMGADQFTTTDSIDWSNTAGAFLSGVNLYYAISANGNLRKIAFTGGEPTGSSTLADGSINWSSHGAFVMRANSTTDLAVSPHGSAREGQPVTLTATVALAADPSSHPGGTVTFYNGSSRLNSTPITVDPATGQAQLTLSDLPPSGPGRTVLAATFQPSDSTVNASFSAPNTYTVNPVATRPTVTGEPRVGATDTCSEPTRPGVNVAYSWVASGKAVGKGKSYTVGAAALHRFLSCRAAVSIGKGETDIATSVGRHVARGPALKVASKPKLRGPHRVGTKESVTLGKWRPAASSYQFRWYVGHHKIHHGTKRKLLVTQSEAGKRLSCRVTARRPGFAKGSATTKRVKISR
jgi:hypothetical protein